MESKYIIYKAIYLVYIEIFPSPAPPFILSVFFKLIYLFLYYGGSAPFIPQVP